METVLMPLKDWLHDERKKKGWSREKLARLAGLSNSAVIKVESGETKEPGFETVRRMVRALGLTLEQLEEALEAEERKAEEPEPKGRKPKK